MFNAISNQKRKLRKVGISTLESETTKFERLRSAFFNHNKYIVL